MLVGQYKNNVTAEKSFFLPPGEWYVVLSILGDTADFGRIKKKERFPLLCLTLKKSNPEDALFNFKQQSVSEVYTSWDTRRLLHFEHPYRQPVDGK
jgi:hypothetical protein